jgi:hypothetical protein
MQRRPPSRRWPRDLEAWHPNPRQANRLLSAGRGDQHHVARHLADRAPDRPREVPAHARRARHLRARAGEDDWKAGRDRGAGSGRPASDGLRGGAVRLLQVRPANRTELLVVEGRQQPHGLRHGRSRHLLVGWPVPVQTVHVRVGEPPPRALQGTTGELRSGRPEPVEGRRSRHCRESSSSRRIIHVSVALVNNAGQSPSLFLGIHPRSPRASPLQRHDTRWRGPGRILARPIRQRSRSRLRDSAIGHSNHAVSARRSGLSTEATHGTRLSGAPSALLSAQRHDEALEEDLGIAP